VPGDLLSVDFIMDPRSAIEEGLTLNAKDVLQKALDMRSVERKVYPRLNPADYTGKKTLAVKICASQS